MDCDASSDGDHSLRQPCEGATFPLATKTLIRSAALPRELFRALSELRLKKDVAGALHWSQKSREILLLGFNDRNALFLQAESCVKQVADALLVRRIPGHHFLSELSPDVTVLRGQLTEPRRKPPVRSLELLELSIGQAQSLLCELGRALPELLLQSGPVAWRGRSHTLRASRHHRDEQRENRESKHWLHHLKSCTS